MNWQDYSTRIRCAPWVWLALLAVLAVWSAPLWHGHDDHADQPDHHDCAVCAVLDQPTGDGLPCLILPPTPAPVFELALGSEAACSFDVLRDYPARGPPTLNA